MHLKIILKKNKDVLSYKTDNIPILYNSEDVLIQGSNIIHNWKNDLNETFYVSGYIIGQRSSTEKLIPIKNFKLLESPDSLDQVEGRFVCIKINELGLCEIYCDNYSRSDIYWLETKEAYFISTTLADLPIKDKYAEIDQIGLAQSLTIYGSRPLKKHTLYKNVKRLGVNESLLVEKGSIKIKKRDFKPLAVSKNLVEKDLNDYSDYFIEAVRSRASEDGNIVYLSSGWDSTSILAVLVHLFGKSKVRCITGRMIYSNRNKYVNKAEIDRAKAVTEYFGVKLDIIDWDYTKNVKVDIDDVRPLFKAHQFGSLTALTQWYLAKAAKEMAKGGEVVFAGEMSDGAHNLGFSQYVSIFHPASQEFREYSDKMASYLFGPTFLNEMHNGNHENDPVWKIYSSIYKNINFDKIAKGKYNISNQMLYSFFLSGGRIPLYSKNNNKLLTEYGINEFSKESSQVYLKEFEGKVNPSNLYSHYLHLYNSFHWQGSTVAPLEYTLQEFGMKCMLPFHDKKVIDFLSTMPESFGRGLDLNPVKYPLKWMLKNKIDYPIHLQVGPHSYLYDVIPGFSLIGEIINDSSFTELYKEILSQGDIYNKMDEAYFDMNYIKGIIKDFLNGKKIEGSELTDLAAISAHSLFGFYE
jgi:hypothetical protein